MPKKFRSWRKESKDDYGQNVELGEFLCAEQVQCGAILRIADALELMIAKEYQKLPEYQKLVEDRDRYRQWYDDERSTRRLLERRISALRGYIGRLKKKK
jgi:hypothetical protein